MKKVLLATSALVALAGAAAAEVTFGGEVEIGYNDPALMDGDVAGFYWSGSLDITGTADFGDVSVEVAYGYDLDAGEFDAFPTITVTTAWAVLTVGEVEYAGTDLFSDLDGMGFAYDTPNYADISVREQDTEIVARVDATFGGMTVGVSFDAGIAGNTVFASDLVSIGFAGEFGGFSVSGMYDQAGYWDNDGNNNTDAVPVGDVEFYGIGMSTSFGGFDIAAAYERGTYTFFGDYSDSLGVSVSSTFGAVTVGGYYAFNGANLYDPADKYGVSVGYTAGALTLGAYWDGAEAYNDGVQPFASTSNFGVDVEYAVNDMISAFAGWDEGDGAYVYATMAVGDAEVGAGYAEYDEAGPAEIKDGLTVWLTMPF